MNPQIMQKYKTSEVQVEGKVSDNYEVWIVQDQAIFISLFSTIHEFKLPSVLSCQHVFEVWERIHKYFNARMKVRLQQLRVELMSIKKGNSSNTEYVLCVKAVTNLRHLHLRYLPLCYVYEDDDRI